MRFIVLALTLSLGTAACKRHRATPAADSAALAAGPKVHWSRAYIVTPAGNTSAVMYLTIENPGARPDTLLRVTTPLVDVAMLHTNTTSGSLQEQHGTMNMTAVTSLQIPPDTTLALAPGGTHVMLDALKHPIARGDSIPVTLIFSRAGALSGNAAVISYTDVDTATAPLAAPVPVDAPR